MLNIALAFTVTYGCTRSFDTSNARISSECVLIVSKFSFEIE